MIDSLNRIFIPELRKLNFTGSFPHFRKIDNDITNLLTFQFDRNGGGFIIELANHKGNEFKTHWGEIITLNKLTAHDLNERMRVYPNSESEENGTDSWFRYDKKSFVNFGNKFDKLSQKVIEKIPVMKKYWAEIE